MHHLQTKQHECLSITVTSTFLKRPEPKSQGQVLSSSGVFKSFLSALASEVLAVLKCPQPGATSGRRSPQSPELPKPYRQRIALIQCVTVCKPNPCPGKYKLSRETGNALPSLVLRTAWSECV